MPAAGLVPPQPNVNSPVLEPKDNTFSILWRNYLVALEHMFRTAQYGPLPQATDDATAAAAGVEVGGFYRNGSIVQIRIA